jgi:hypothetical protein
VWKYHIGGYQICDKWLKDRAKKGGKNSQPGQILTNNEVKFFQKIISSLNETIIITKKIDKVIETHGGWPNAFSNSIDKL